MSYCQDHVYLVEKLQSAGDFQEVLYRESGCPFCRLDKYEKQISRYKLALDEIAQLPRQPSFQRSDSDYAKIAIRALEI